MFYQVPFEILAYLIYLICAVNPIALVGLGAFLIFIPVIFLILMSVMQSQKKIMSARDLRIKRANEILQGIKVIKLFAIETIQEARLRNAREREIATLFGLSY